MASQVAEAARAVGVRVERVARTFGAVAALGEVSLAIEPGSFVALVGPSGCGKTTLLRMIGGLDRPDAGTIDAGGARPAICFQEPRLLPWRSAIDNASLPLELAGVPRADARERAREALRRVHLADAVDRLPHQLSGGMRMRVALARTLVERPRLVLLDEPFSALDEVTRQELGEELFDLWTEDRFTALLVTHSIGEAVFLATRCAVFSPRPGRILHVEEIALARHDPLVRTSVEFNDHVRTIAERMRAAMRGTP